MHQQRRWAREIVGAATFCIALVVIVLLANAWYRGEECYNSIRVGMSADEIHAIMERHGYKLVGGDGNGREFVMVFGRHKDDRWTHRAIVLIFDANGILKKKERGGPD